MVPPLPSHPVSVASLCSHVAVASSQSETPDESANGQRTCSCTIHILIDPERGARNIVRTANQAARAGRKEIAQRDDRIGRPPGWKEIFASGLHIVNAAKGGVRATLIKRRHPSPQNFRCHPIR